MNTGASQVPQSDENQGQVSDLVKQLETGDSDNNAVVNGTREKLEYPGSQHARVDAGGNVTECDEGFVRAMEIENASNRLHCQSVERETPQTVENVTLKDEIRDSDVWNVAYEIYCAGGWVDNGNEPNPPTDGIWKLLDRAADIRKREVRHEAYEQDFMDAMRYALINVIGATDAIEWSQEELENANPALVNALKARGTREKLNAIRAKFGAGPTSMTDGQIEAMNEHYRPKKEVDMVIIDDLHDEPDFSTIDAICGLCADIVHIANRWQRTN